MSVAVRMHKFHSLNLKFDTTKPMWSLRHSTEIFNPFSKLLQVGVHVRHRLPNRSRWPSPYIDHLSGFKSTNDAHNLCVASDNISELPHYGEISMLAKASFATMIPIRNMDRAIKFYRKALGGSLNMRAPGDMRNYWASVSVGKSEFWLIRPDKREKRDLAYSTFVVRDIKKTVGGLKKKGVRFLPGEKMGPDSRVEGPIVYGPYGAGAIFKDSEGNLFMLWENARM